MKINNFQGDVSDISAKKEPVTVLTFFQGPDGEQPARSKSVFNHEILLNALTALKFQTRELATRASLCGMVFQQHERQCCFFSRNTGLVTPKIIYFHYLKNVLSGSKHPKNK